MRNHAPICWISSLVLLVEMGCGGGSSPQPAPVDEVPAVGPGFVGSERCLSCHETATDWRGSHHERAWSAPDAVPEAFEGPPMLELAGFDRPLAVVGWVGWDPLRQPLVEVGGRVQAAPVAWDPAAKEWFDLFDDGRQAGDRGHWTGPAMSWNTQCAPCHTTGLEPAYDPATDRFETEVAEQGVGCESCHGAGAVHAAEQGQIPVAKPGEAVCGSCHSRRAELVPGAGPELGYLDRHAPQLVDLSDSFFADGQVRDEDFELNAFWTSRMHAEGVTCGDCHDAHSGALVGEGDALCLGCHEDHEGWQAHDRHDGEVGCVDCHMPQTTYMQRHPRRDHGFRIPDPALAAEIGAPDTCTRGCHTDREPSWSAEALKDWGVDSASRPQRTRARAVSAARGGGDTGYVGALDLLASDPHPTWRAIGAGLLGPWAGRADVLEALDKASRDGDPLVRFGAFGSLPAGHPAHRRGLHDPVRAVRVQAARGLQSQVSPRAAETRDLSLWLDGNRDQPDVALEWANWRLAHGDLAGLDELKRAWTLWPKDPVVVHGYAVALAGTGRADDAARVLEQSVLDMPKEALLWDALGRARAGVGDAAGGVAALERAVALDSTLSRTWYNLGILRDGSGDARGALAAYSRATDANPLDPDPPWAAASLELRRERWAEAERWNAEALRRDPSHAGAADVAKRLSGPR